MLSLTLLGILFEAVVAQKNTAFSRTSLSSHLSDASFALNTTGDLPPLVFLLPYSDGLSGVLIRIAFIYQHSQRNRTIILPRYKCPVHYPDIHEVNLCDYIQFPPRVHCDPSHNVSYYLQQGLSCDILTYSSDLKELHLKYHRQRFIPHSCVGGIFPWGSYGALGWNFSDRMWELFQFTMYNIFRGNRIIAFHWRRGDQLYTRCRSGLDKSINCLSAHDLIKAVQSKLSLMKDTRNIYKVYIATNEANQTTLDELSRAGFQHTTMVVEEIQRLYLGLNSLEKFIIDVMLMCCSHRFFHYGESTVNKLVSDCRQRIRKDFDRRGMLSAIKNKFDIP